MSSPEVSIIIPVYNRASSITCAIRSAIDQTYTNFELIVVDDASTDDLDAALATVNDTRILRLSHEQNQGAAAARNTGILKAQGRYIAFLDSDDRWLSQKLERQMDFMGKCSVTASCTGYEIFSKYHPDGEIRVVKNTLKRKDLLLGCRVSPGSTLMVEKAVFDRVGLFDESMRRLEDWDWLLRFSEQSSLAVLPDVLAVIDSLSDADKHYSDVAESVVAMKRKYGHESNFSRSEQKQILGALENELAAIAFKKKRLGAAASHFAKSLWYNPHRSLDTIVRIIRAIRIDAFGVRGRQRVKNDN